MYQSEAHGLGANVSFSDVPPYCTVFCVCTHRLGRGLLVREEMALRKRTAGVPRTTVGIGEGKVEVDCWVTRLKVAALLAKENDGGRVVQAAAIRHTLGCGSCFTLLACTPPLCTARAVVISTSYKPVEQTLLSAAAPVEGHADCSPKRLGVMCNRAFRKSLLKWPNMRRW